MAMLQLHCPTSEYVGAKGDTLRDHRSSLIHTHTRTHHSRGMAIHRTWPIVRAFRVSIERANSREARRDTAARAVGKQHHSRRNGRSFVLMNFMFLPANKKLRRVVNITSVESHTLNRDKEGKPMHAVLELHDRRLENTAKPPEHTHPPTHTTQHTDTTAG